MDYPNNRFAITDAKTINGFTLMETALALLVIGLAFLTIMGLGRGGQESVHDANDEVRCETMASSIFETLRIYNQRFHEQSLTNLNGITWANLWAEAATRPEYIPFPPVAGMSESDNIYLKINRGVANTYNENSISLTDWNPRYILEMVPGTNSYIALGFNYLTVGLTIYPDGDTLSSADRFFTTVLTNEGGL